MILLLWAGVSSKVVNVVVTPDGTGVYTLQSRLLGADAARSDDRGGDLDEAVYTHRNGNTERNGGQTWRGFSTTIPVVILASNEESIYLAGSYGNTYVNELYTDFERCRWVCRSSST